jgi:sialate O-acetylesterase
MKKKFFLPVFLAFGFCCRAKVSLPALFSNHMVLQQKSTVPVWGWAEAGKKIRLVTGWNQHTYSASAAADGSWKIQVGTPAAGGPYKISISDGEETVLDNILIGEVWLCSGQSNMEMPMKGFPNQPVAGADELIATSSNPVIRLFTIKRNAAVQPLDTISGAWQQAGPEAVKEFSAVGYLYARLLQQHLNVPVGIINSSWGGTPIEAWMPAGSVDETTRAAAPKQPLRNSAAALHNGMIHPIAGYGIKGFLWYQGEANRRNADRYAGLMETMVHAWRTGWNNQQLPFYYVQIAPFERRGDSSNAGARLREAQLKASLTIPYSGMAVLTDIGSPTTVHPPDKFSVAQRLYRIALSKTYGREKEEWSGPVYKSMRIVNDTIEVQFNHAANGLTSQNGGLHQFEIAGEDKIFHPAEAVTGPQGIAVFSKDVKKPVALRYAYKDWVTGDLFNREGLPASSFRTDAW